MQWLQWNVSSHDTFGKEDIRNTLRFSGSWFGLHSSCHAEFSGKPPFLCFCFEERFGTRYNSVTVWWTPPNPSSISYIFPLTSCDPTEDLALCTWGASAPAALQPINQSLQQPWNEPYAAQAGLRQKTMVLYTQELQVSFPGCLTCCSHFKQVPESNVCFGI